MKIFLKLTHPQLNTSYKIVITDRYVIKYKVYSTDIFEKTEIKEFNQFNSLLALYHKGIIICNMPEQFEKFVEKNIELFL